MTMLGELDFFAGRIACGNVFFAHWLDDHWVVIHPTGRLRQRLLLLLASGLPLPSGLRPWAYGRMPLITAHDVNWPTCGSDYVVRYMWALEWGRL